MLMVGEDGFEPSKRNVTDLQSAPFGLSGTPPLNGAGNRNRTPVTTVKGWCLDRLTKGPSGASCRSRTNNLLITSQLLCHWANEAYPLYFNYIILKVATQKGLEPSTSGVTGRHSNQLSYWAAFGGNNRDRTCDPLLVRQMLSQLSYASKY